MYIKTLLIILVICIVNLSHAQFEDLNAPIPVNKDVKTGTLDNGLTYYIRYNPLPKDKIELRLVINAGSILEDENQRGLAHFMEHMNFNGTKNFKKNDLIDYLQTAGVKFGHHLNAYTSFDETVYILPIPTDDETVLDNGFQILEDWAHNALLTGEDIDNERGIVLEEYRIGLGPEQRMLKMTLPKLLYQSKYAERLPIGTKESLENFSHDDLRGFYRDWYRPDLMAVIAVGDYDPGKIEEKIKQYLSRIPKREAPRKRKNFDIPNHKETLIAVESDPEASYSLVNIIYKDSVEAKPNATVGDYRSLMTKGLFRQMFATRMGELVRKPNPPFLFAQANYGSIVARGKNAFQAMAAVGENGQLRGFEALLTEIEKVKKHGFQEAEFERAKKNVLAHMKKIYNERDKARSKSFVRELVGNFLEQEPIPGIEWEYQYYERFLPEISLDEVNSLIKKWVRADNRVIVFTGPEKEELTKVTQQEIEDVLVKIEGKEIEKPEEETIDLSLIDSIPEKGEIVSETFDPKNEITTLLLSNGAKVLYKKTSFKNDEILFNIFSYGGSSYFSDEDFEKTRYGLELISSAGVGKLNRTNLSKALAGKYVSVSPYVNSLSEGLRGSSTPEDLETAFQLINQYFTNPNYDDEAFLSYQSRQKEVLENLLLNPNTFFGVEMQKVLTQDHPRASNIPSPKDIDGIDYSLLYNLGKERFANAGDFVFCFVGNIDDTHFKDYVATYLASLPDAGKREDIKDLGIRPPKGVVEKIFEKGIEPKSIVSINFGGETTYSLMESYNLSCLGEILTTKLNERLREDMSGVYGIYADGGIRKLPSALYSFSIKFSCSPDNVETLKKACFEEMNKIIKKGPEQKDIDKIKQAHILSYKEALEKNAFWLSNLKSSEYYDFEIDELLDKMNRTEKLKKSKLKKVAKRYLTNDYVVGILMPEKDAVTE